MKIKIVMTTFNRLDLVEGTVESLVKSEYCPEGIIVVDDQSDDQTTLKKIISKLPKPELSVNGDRVGCDANTPKALEKAFSDKETEYALVLDSDVLVIDSWYTVLKRCVFTMQLDKKIAAIQLLNLDNLKKKRLSDKYSDLLKAITLSGCGMLVSRYFYENFIKKQEAKGWWRWDMNSAEMAFGTGMDIYCLRDSAIQHTGDVVGTHKGVGQVATTFRADVKKAFQTAPEELSRVTLVIGGGYHNAAAGIVATRALIRAGIVAHLFIQWDEWYKLIRAAAKDIKIKTYQNILTNTPDQTVIHPTQELRKLLSPGSNPINFDLDSDENRWMLYSLDGDINQFIAHKLRICFGVEVSSTFDWEDLKVKDKKFRPRVDISNRLVVNNLKGDAEELASLYKDFDREVIILQNDKPQKSMGEALKSHLFKLKPLEVASTISMAGEFASVLNSTAFVCLFADCKRYVFDVDYETKYNLPVSVDNDKYGLIQDVADNVAIIYDGDDKSFWDFTPKERVFKTRKDINIDYKCVISVENCTGFYRGWIADMIDWKEPGGYSASILCKSKNSNCMTSISDKNGMSPTNCIKTHCRLIGVK